MKRLQFITTLVALLISISIHAEVLSGNCGANGDNLTWTLDTQKGLLKIEGSGNMANYFWSGPNAPWYSNREHILNLSLPDGLTSIGPYAFYDCNGLTSISIPNSVKSIGNYAFWKCSGLTSVSVSNSVTSIGDEAFLDCSGLSSVTIPNSVTSIGDGVFRGCFGLTEPIIVNNIFVLLPSTFEGSYVIPSKVTKIIGSAFYSCKGLTSVTIPKSVTSIERNTFENCTGLTNVTIPNSVTSIGTYAFWNCSGLTSLTIPNSVTSIGVDAFFGCNSIQKLYINTTINPGATSLLSNFSCEELYIGDSVSIVYNYFNTSKLHKVVLGMNVSQIRGSAFSDAYIQSFTITGEEPPFCYPNIFGTKDLSNATLYVPKDKANYYQTTEPWTKFGIEKTLSGETPSIPTACEKPTISYSDGQLQFACETEGAKIHYSITDEDIKIGTLSGSGPVNLAACYNISAYATADEYTQSETATATLYWVKNNASIETNINSAKMRGVVVSADEGVVSVSGLDNGEQVLFYRVDGSMLGKQKAQSGAASLATSEKIVIVKVGDSSMKVLVK